MWKLVIEDDEGKRTVVPLTRDDYTIGRKEGNTIRLTERNVSREHAKLRRRKMNGAGGPLQYTLEDCTSYNGVYVNGLRVASAQELVHGDLIQIGDYRMVLQDDQVVEAPAAVPSISADSKATIPTSLVNRGVTLMERPNRLVMLAGPTPGAEYPLDRERLTVGRAEDATISVNHNSVSRLHCEIHLLGEARYEIVDKGSSNGVRVNGAELKRGIVEAGDVIELGDVKFKFVGAGQIFLPGINDSQQLATIGDRPPLPPRSRRLGVLPYVILGALFAGAVLVMWALYQRHAQSVFPTPTITSESLSRDQAVLNTARALADRGDLEEAHTKLTTDITMDTTRASAEFISLETRWAQDQIARAKGADPSAQRVILGRVTTSGLPRDHALRTEASELLAALDKPQAPIPSLPVAALPPVAVVPSPIPPPVTTVTRVDTPPVPPPTPQPPTVRKPPPPPPDPPATPTPTRKPPEPARSGVEQAREALLQNRPEIAKQLLMDKCAALRCSQDEARVLKGACDGVKDRNCTEFLKDKYFNR